MCIALGVILQDERTDRWRRLRLHHIVLYKAVLPRAFPSTLSCCPTTPIPQNLAIFIFYLLIELFESFFTISVA